MTPAGAARKTHRQPQKVGTVPSWRPNVELRSQAYLTEKEVEQLIRAAAKVGRYPLRDATLILLAYRHGLRVSELVDLRWDAVDLEQGFVHVSRRKNGRDAVHPLTGRELRALRRLRRDYQDSPFVFVSERGGPMTTSNLRKMLSRAGEGLGISVHPQMLRHACGFKLANEGIDTRSIQAFMGNASLASTVINTDIAPQRFKGFWKN